MKYFAYGSNMHPVRLKLRAPSAKFYKVISLRKYKLKFNKIGIDGSGKCNLCFTGNIKDVVHGVIYDIVPSDIDLLDTAESLGHGYLKKRLFLEDIGIEMVFYIAQKEFIDDSLYPYTWYKNLVLEGARYYKLPKEYIDMINSVKSVEDLDKSREKEAQAILKALKI